MIIGPSTGAQPPVGYKRCVDNTLTDGPTTDNPAQSFDDLLTANRRYGEGFTLGGLPAPARRGLAVVTCMDSRIEPLQMLGLVPGDAKIMRNAGARVTDDALRSLILAVNLLNVSRIALVQHTDCAMTKDSEDGLRAKVSAAAGADASDWTFLTTADQEGALREDVARLAACPLVASDVMVGGFIYDVDTGLLRRVA